ncbi:uncharacterized protein [Physcomitrium patens]|uniref:uncharacterized protein n=1 Tax=Physcomitrium patens TaxID=3218 RepID=UPI003CCCEF65|nr:DNA-damage responsive transcription factor [Physcomitrium patens]
MDRVTGKRALCQSKSCCDYNAAAHAKLDSLPAGVRFDPSDEELLDHLAAKIGRGSKKPHPLLDEFIHTLEEEDGICRTHPENLPGVKKDGSSCHYFHRPSMAYTTGTRKRRKIQTDDIPDGGADVRWHKTGKTRPVSQGGKVLGHKKIMVLYRATGKKSKNMKTNWVMHQYHLGSNEEETDGELVVCKVFFQKAPRSCPSRRTEASAVDDVEGEPSESDIGFQAPGLSGDSPSVSVVTRGRPPLTPRSCPPSRTAKQLYAEPTESRSEIFDPQLLATQSKQRGVQSHMDQCNDKEGVGEDIGVDMNLEATGYVVYELGDVALGTLGAAMYDGNQTKHINAGLSGQLFSEGEDQSFQAVNLNEEHESWGLDHSVEATKNEDPSVMSLLCDEHLNGDPLAEDAEYEDFNFRSLSYDVGCSVEDEPFRGVEGDRNGVDPALDTLVLDTPPDMLEYPVVTSQEVRDWLGKHPIVGLDNTDSQSTT